MIGVANKLRGIVAAYGEQIVVDEKVSCHTR